jgi:anti-sigma factor NepR-like protein
MKEHKSPGQGLPEQSSARSDFVTKNGAAGTADRHQNSERSAMTAQKPLRPGSMMQGEIQTRGKRGRLSREALVKLGRVLETYFDDVRNEGVPDRFKDLLGQYEERRAQTQPAQQFGEGGEPEQPLVDVRKDKGSA